MPRPPKVYSATVMGLNAWHDVLQSERHHRQVRVVVAAPSKAAAVRAINAAGVHMTAHDFNQYGGETGNEHDVQTALAQPGRVFYGSLNGQRRAALHLAEVTT